jgi:3'(2'), 5'-bisphosphate nucleotidase
MDDSMNALLDEVTLIARAAGEAIMEVYRGHIEVERKEDNSPLTVADLAANHVIQCNLQKLTPELPIISEESASIDYSIRSTWRRYWLVDPLDGTREFIKRNDEFTVNIALIEEGRPVLGVVYAPAMGLTYTGSAEAGATRQKGLETPTQIFARPLDAAHPIIAGSRSHANEKMEAFLQNVAEDLAPPQLISLGSSLKICLVAEGIADVYPRLGPTSEWDTAAAQAVLENAGGSLVDKSGNPLRYNTKESLLNPEFFARGCTPYPWYQYLN